MIFFDIDGTLIDHKRAEYLGVKAFFSEYCKCFEMVEDLFYDSWCKISDKYFNKFLKGDISFEQQRTNRIKDVFTLSGIYLSDDEANEKFKIYRRYYEENLIPYEDVSPCLKMLRTFKLGIISNGDLNQQMYKLKMIGDVDIFSTIITAGDVGVAKPRAEIFQIACERSNVDINDCIYVGDDIETDILSCTKAGMKGIWLNRKSEECAYPEVTMVHSLMELKDVISNRWLHG